jgi:hypothetical protein
MTHTSAPAIASPPVSVPNQSFFAWLRTQTALFVGQILALVGAVGSIAGLAYYVGNLHGPPILTPPAISTMVIYSHLVFLTVFIIWLIKGLDDKRGVYRASRVHDLLTADNFGAASLTEAGRKDLAEIAAGQVRTFKIWFLLFWCAMLLLYIVFTIDNKYGALLRPDPSIIFVNGRSLIFPFLTFFANNVSMFFIFGCFVALYLPAGATERSAIQPLNDEQIKDDHAEHRRRQKKLLWVFAILLSLFTLAYPAIYWLRPLELTVDNWSDYPAIFNALSGTLNAVVVALLIARLDSKLIGLPPWLISILYFYSGIQPMFVVFEQHVDEFDAIRAVVLVVVFIFKLYFFLIILYSLHEGRLLNYFYCSPLLNQHIKVKHNEVVRVRSSPGKKKKVKARAQSIPTKRSVVRDKLKRFSGRFRTEWRLMVTKLLGWLGIIYFVSSLLFYAGIFHSRKTWSTLCVEEPAIFSPHLKLLLIYAHLPLLLAIIIFLLCVKRWLSSTATHSGSPDPKSRLRQFQNFFLIFWGVMFLFYAIYAYKEYNDPEKAFWQGHEANVSTGSSSKESSETPKEPSPTPSGNDKQTAPPQHHHHVNLMMSATAPSEAPETGDPKQEEKPKEKPPLPLPAGSRTPCSNMGHDVFEKILVALKLPVRRDHDSQSTHGQPPAAGQNTQTQSSPNSAWIYSVITFILNNLMVLFVFLCFSVLYLSVEERHGDRKYRSFRNYAILVYFLITVTIPLSLFTLDKATMNIVNPAVAITVVAAVGGVLNAVAFALLFARLDSRLIRLPSSVISILYVYAALQPLFVVFERGTPVFSAIETSAVGAALIFKICFVLVIFHALHTGSIEYHLKNFPRLNSRVNSIFANQYEIRVFKNDKQFKFAIFKNDAQVFKSDEPHPTLKECNDTVRDVQKLMEDKNNYERAPSVQGTYWVQIMKRKEDGTKTNEPLCESKDLLEDEIDDLIAECVEKVPYCKYSRV